MCGFPRIEVQRTITIADMIAYWMASKGLRAPATIHTDNMGILNWLHCGEQCALARTPPSLWVIFREEIEKVHGEDIKSSVKHVKAHRTENDKAEMTLFERFVM